MPMPTAAPFTAATIGFERRSSATQSRPAGMPPEPPAVSSPGSSPSMPRLERLLHVGAGAEAAARAGHDDRADARIRVGAPRSRRPARRAMRGVQAFSFSGRFSVMSATASRRSTRIRESAIARPYSTRVRSPWTTSGLSRRRDPHRQPAPRPQREPQLRLHPRSRRQPQPVALHRHRHHELRLHQRELVPDAQARPAAEREVGEARPLAHALGREALGIEALGVVPERAGGDASRTG